MPPPSSTPLPLTNLSILITGAGFAGLTAAIECRTLGATVTLLEASTSRRQLGDIISFGSNSGRIFRRWPGVEEALDPICHHSSGLDFRTYDDEFLCRQTWGAEAEQWGKRFNGHRGEIHDVVWKHALSVGVEIRLGCKVVEYVEEEEGGGGSAGVVLQGGERLRGDVVLAGDGVRSSARRIVLGFEDRPQSSGYAVYRAWMGTEGLRENPLTAWLADPETDHHVGWLGPDVHFLVATLQRGTACSWVLTHKDTADITESWSHPGTTEDAISTIPNWAPIVHAIIRATPPNPPPPAPPSLVDWKLVFRDPLPTWISPHRRIALIGDAAHPFLPTSIQGASQSMEDGVTLAVCLERAATTTTTTTTSSSPSSSSSSKTPIDVPLALRAYEKIRYQRVLATQRTGVTNRDAWHKADFDYVRKHPESVKLPRQDWVLNFDAMAHAHEVLEGVVRELREEPGWRPDPTM